MYIHRYIRLTPILGITILFVLSVAKYFGLGPFWNIFFENINSNCNKWWWTSILYVQNYVNPDEIVSKKSIFFNFFLLN